MTKTEFLEKGYPILFYIVLVGLFLKGEVFRIHTSWFSFTFTSVKNLTFLFIFWWLLLQIIKDKKPHFSLGLSLILLTGILSIITSSYPIASLKAGWVLLIYIGWFYSMWLILQEPRYRIHLSILIISLACIVALADLWFHKEVGIEKIIEEYPFWEGKNALGLFLAMSLCVCGSWIVNIKQKRFLWPLIINFLILMLGIALSYSRGALIAGLVGIIGILCSKFRKMIWVIIGCIVILLVISPQFVSKRFSSIFDINELNIKNRISLWKDTVEIIKEKPLMGTGLGTFTESYLEHYPDKAPVNKDEARIIRHAHSLYLQILVETGIIGFLVFLWLIIMGFIRAIRNLIKEKDPYLVAVRYGSLLGIVSLLVYSISDCTVSWQFIGDSFSHINLIWLLLWVCVLIRNQKPETRNQRLDNGN